MKSDHFENVLLSSMFSSATSVSVAMFGSTKNPCRLICLKKDRSPIAFRYIHVHIPYT